MVSRYKAATVVAWRDWGEVHPLPGVYSKAASPDKAAVTFIWHAAAFLRWTPTLLVRHCRNCQVARLDACFPNGGAPSIKPKLVKKITFFFFLLSVFVECLARPWDSPSGRTFFSYFFLEGNCYNNISCCELDEFWGSILIFFQAA